MTDTVEALQARIRELEAEIADLTRLHSVDDCPPPEGQALYFLEVPNKLTGEMELVCAGLMSGRSFPALKHFMRLPPLRNLPCPIARPARPAPAPRGPQQQKYAPVTNLSQRRQPGMKLDGTPRKPRRPRGPSSSTGK